MRKLSVPFLRGLVFLVAGGFVAMAQATTVYAGGSYDYVVPANVYRISVGVYGAGGGAGGVDDTRGGSGGSGQRLSAVINVTPGQHVSGVIGGRGENGQSSFANIPGPGGPGDGPGGSGGRMGTSQISGTGGGGGGASSLYVDGITILKAAGGGGGQGGARYIGTAFSGGNAGSIAYTDCSQSQSGGTGGDVGNNDGGGGGGGGGGYTGGSGGGGVMDFEVGGGSSANAGGSCVFNGINNLLVSTSVGPGAYGGVEGVRNAEGGSVLIDEVPIPRLTVTLNMNISGTVPDLGLFNLSISNGNPTGGSNPNNTQGSGSTTGAVSVDRNTVLTLTGSQSSGTSLTNYDSTIACVDDTGAAYTTGVGGSAGTFSVTTGNSGASPNLVCTITNLVIVPTLKIVKTVTTGSGTNLFNFLFSGMSEGQDRISVTGVGSGNGTAGLFSIAGNTVKISESSPAGWPANPVSASCVDSNYGRSGNPSALLGILIGNELSIPTANMVNWAVFTCTFTNAPGSSLHACSVSPA